MLRIHYSVLLLLLCLFGCRGKQVIFQPGDITTESKSLFNGDSSALILHANTNAWMRPVRIKAGKYVVSFSAEGKPVNGILPQLRLFLGEEIFYSDSVYIGTKEYEARFEVREELTEKIQFECVHKAAAGDEDSLVVIQFPVILRPY